MICSEEHNCTNDNEKTVDSYDYAFRLILKRRVSSLTVRESQFRGSWDTFLWKIVEIRTCIKTLKIFFAATSTVVLKTEISSLRRYLKTCGTIVFHHFIER